MPIARLDYWGGKNITKETGVVRIWLFGSRVRDDARGGDVDLLLELDEAVAEPAQLSSRLAALAEGIRL